MNQYEIIVKASKKKFISPIDCLNLGGGMKLATRIGELKRAGYEFSIKWHPSKKFKIYKCIHEPKGN